ncbi:hypothetical protein BDZ94DRAFT_1264982 [Collybia nuda]|uniref:Uncharacterized protein n=1 Tax=Collybia nuda TaxID=64659 RepID=A0A9P6CCQ2_9AGAR|nr:hypothetical protein BDZ94DRAFT_1264982 [Collybia nuda]
MSTRVCFTSCFAAPSGSSGSKINVIRSPQGCLGSSYLSVPGTGWGIPRGFFGGRCAPHIAALTKVFKKKKRDVDIFDGREKVE